MVSKRLGMALFVVAAMALGTTAAQASQLNSIIKGAVSDNGGSSVFFTIDDTSRETLVKSDGAGGFLDPVRREDGGFDGQDTQLNEGDRLRGVMKFDGYEVNEGTKEPISTFEITALFDTIVTSKVESGGEFTYTFGAYDGFASEVAGYSNVDASAGDLEGLLVAIFEDDTPDFSVDPNDTFAQNESTATDGTPWAFLGFTGTDGDANVGEGWATTPLPSDDITAIPGGVSAGQANIALNRLAVGDSLSSELLFFLQNSPVFAPLAGDTVEFTAVASFESTSTSSWPLSNDAALSMTVAPTPTASLAGMMAFGMIAAAYRRRTGKVATA